jgi:pSer/pThr/pTyr-binding forkhead associated (FHA) protein
VAINVRTVESPSATHSATPAELQQRLEAERRGLPFLVWRDPDGQRILTLDESKPRCTVGRGPEVDVGLDFDEQVSRLHAEIERIGGDWTVADDGLSRNGSYVNGERIGGRRRLVENDELQFGATIVLYRAPQPASGSATVAAPDRAELPELTEAQRRVLIALCRPFREGSQYATPATNQQIAEEVFLSLDAVKGHLRVLFDKFGIGDLPQNQKRVRLIELALRNGVISVRDLG